MTFHRISSVYRNRLGYHDVALYGLPLGRVLTVLGIGRNLAWCHKSLQYLHSAACPLSLFFRLLKKLTNQFRWDVLGTQRAPRLSTAWFCRRYQRPIKKLMNWQEQEWIIQANLASTQLRWTGQVLRIENERIPKQLLYGQVGGQKLRYKDVVKQHA